jgi:N-acetylglucosaminyl-diphospho-decaprenol L-rhamnosyltransferase
MTAAKVKSRQTVADLDIGLIYTHERDWMPRLLPSLHASGNGLAMRLILVDNHSDDGVEPWLPLFPETTVVRNQCSLSYAENLNRILAASTAPYVLLLNTDLLFDVEEQCLAKMVRFMNAHPDCGISGCRVYHEDGSYAHPARRFQTLRIILARRLGLGRLWPTMLNRYLYRERSTRDSFACDWISGCFMLVRREAIREVGPFDEGYLKYFEDCDICLRMARSGWSTMHCGKTYCYHLEHRASKRLLSLDAWKHVRSYARWLRKWGFSPAIQPAAEPERKRHAA